MGEVEIWKDIEGYEGLYQVSNYGQVKSLAKTIIRKNNTKQTFSERILKPFKDTKGYMNVKLFKTCKIHRLVALAFIPNDNPTDKNQINHLDENKENNHVSNLCWCSCIENINYGTRNERASKKNKGQKRTNEVKQKISKAKFIPIIQYTLDNEFVKEWDSAKSASEELNVYATSITACCKNKLKSAYGFIWRYKETTI